MIGPEIGQLQGAGLILDQHPIGRPRIPSAATRPMLRDRHVERCQFPDRGIGDSRNKRPVHEAHGQMPQKIDRPGMGALVPWGHQSVEQPFDTRPDAFQSAG